MTSAFSTDYNFGKNNESNILPIITNFFKRDIKTSTNQFSIYDFYDNKYKYELKTRRNNKNTYPTILISFDKIQPNTILLFNFIDGLYYIECNNDFEKYEKKYFQRARPGHNDVNKLVIHIPTKDIKLICSYEYELDF